MVRGVLIASVHMIFDLPLEIFIYPEEEIKRAVDKKTLHQPSAG